MLPSRLGRRCATRRRQGSRSPGRGTESARMSAAPRAPPGSTSDCRQEADMTTTLADARVGQIHISVTEIDRSVAFYRDTLGLPFLFRVPGQPMAFFDCGGTRLYLAVP